MYKTKALPIGYSDIKEVIATGYYVDKTEYAQALIEKQNPIFIARPRRFGKSLFIDTIATICKGEKEIFKDCHIGKPENGYAWEKYPVIRLDFSGLNNNTTDLLELSLDDLLPINTMPHTYLEKKSWSYWVLILMKQSGQ